MSCGIYYISLLLISTNLLVTYIIHTLFTDIKRNNVMLTYFGNGITSNKEKNIIMRSISDINEWMMILLYTIFSNMITFLHTPYDTNISHYCLKLKESTNIIIILTNIIVKMTIINYNKTINN